MLPRLLLRVLSRLRRHEGAVYRCLQGQTCIELAGSHLLQTEATKCAAPPTNIAPVKRCLEDEFPEKGNFCEVLC